MVVTEQTKQEPRLLSPLTLAFLGDVVYELMVRERLVQQGTRPAGALHRLAVDMVSATAQAKAFPILEAMLNEEELSILMRGRNANSTRIPKSCSADEYRKATAIEALFGYLHLKNRQDRLEEIFTVMESTLLEKQE